MTAVGRIADFDRALEQTQDAVITLPVVMALRGLSARLRGFRFGASDEKYSLVGTDSPPDAASLSSVGALDLLRREGTTAFVHRLLGSEPKVERVTKFEDLLPLLQMQRVDAVLLPARLFSEIQASSRLNLTQTELGARVGLPALAQVTPAGSQITSAIVRMPPEAAKPMGVEEWR